MVKLLPRGDCFFVVSEDFFLGYNLATAFGDCGVD
jgi:hypothetical protein